MRGTRASRSASARASRSTSGASRSAAAASRSSASRAPSARPSLRRAADAASVARTRTRRASASRSSWREPSSRATSASASASARSRASSSPAASSTAAAAAARSAGRRERSPRALRRDRGRARPSAGARRPPRSPPRDARRAPRARARDPPGARPPGQYAACRFAPWTTCSPARPSTRPRYLAGLPDRPVGADRRPSTSCARRSAARCPSGPRTRGAVVDAARRRGRARASSRSPARATSASSSAARCPVALAADWLDATWDQNAGSTRRRPAVAVIEEVARELAARAVRPPARRVASASSPAARWRNFTCLAAARHARAAPRGLGRRGATASPARRRSARRRRRARTSPSTWRCGSSASARARRGRVAADDQGRMRADALRDALRDGRRPDDRLRAGRQREHRRVRPAREIVEARARARRVAARRRRVRAVGARQPGAARTSSPASSSPTRGRPTRTSGSTSRTTAASRSSRHPEAHRASMAVTRRVPGARRPTASATTVDWTPEFSRRARGVPRLRRAALARPQRRRGARRALLRACAGRIAERLRRRPASRSSTTSSSTRCSCASAATTRAPPR